MKNNTNASMTGGWVILTPHPLTGEFSCASFGPYSSLAEARENANRLSCLGLRCRPYSDTYAKDVDLHGYVALLEAAVK